MLLNSVHLILLRSYSLSLNVLYRVNRLNYAHMLFKTCQAYSIEYHRLRRRLAYACVSTKIVNRLLKIYRVKYLSKLFSKLFSTRCLFVPILVNYSRL